MPHTIKLYTLIGLMLAPSICWAEGFYLRPAFQKVRVSIDAGAASEVGSNSYIIDRGYLWRGEHYTDYYGEDRPSVSELSVKLDISMFDHVRVGLGYDWWQLYELGTIYIDVAAGASWDTFDVGLRLQHSRRESNYRGPNADSGGLTTFLVYRFWRFAFEVDAGFQLTTVWRGSDGPQVNPLPAGATRIMFQPIPELGIAIGTELDVNGMVEKMELVGSKSVGRFDIDLSASCSVGGDHIKSDFKLGVGFAVRFHPPVRD